MLTEICEEIRNYFCDVDTDVHSGQFTITDGSIEPLSFLQNGQYFRIVGSVFNDGVHQYGLAENLENEAFTGQIWAMKVPKAVLQLESDIIAWNEANKDALDSPYVSESFGGYSYTKRTSGTQQNAVLTWKEQFAPQLNHYRKVSVI